MTTVEAMKQLVCYIKNDGTTIADITETNATNIWVLMGEAFNERFNSGGTSEQPGTTTTPLGELTLVSSPGTVVGTTTIEVSGATGSNFKYKVDGNVSAYGQDLNTWETWNGGEITVEDGAHLCIAEVDSNFKAVAAGYVTVSTKLI